MSLLREWQRLRDEEASIIDSGHEFDSKPVQTVNRRIIATERMIFAEPTTDMADLAAKLCVATGLGDWDLEGKEFLWDEARTLIGRIM